MASVFKRKGKKNWYVEFTDEHGRRRQKTSGTTSKRRAEQFGADLEHRARQIRAGLIDSASIERVKADAKALKTHIKEYIRHSRTIHAPRHVQCKEQHLARFVELSRAAHLSEINAERFTRLVEVLQESGKSARTINQHRASLKAFCAWCVETGKLARNPMDAVKPWAEEARWPRRALTIEEIRRLLAACQTPERRVFYLAALYAGLRRGELERLAWNDIDWEANTLMLRETKAKRTQKISIHPELRAALEQLAEESRSTVGFGRVFPSAPTNEERRADFERAGIRHIDEKGRRVDLHSFRRTLGTLLAQGGVAPKDAQQVLRHADSSTTLRHYTDARDDAGAEALDVLPSLGFTGGQWNVQDAAHGSTATGREPLRVEPFSRKLRRQAQPPAGARLRSSSRAAAGKRANGLEPSTFSLEG